MIPRGDDAHARITREQADPPGRLHADDYEARLGMKMNARLAAVLLSAMPLLSGCISFSSTPQPVAPLATACMYAGQPYSPGARIFPPNSTPLQCRIDGSWSPG